MPRYMIIISQVLKRGKGGPKLDTALSTPDIKPGLHQQSLPDKGRNVNTKRVDLRNVLILSQSKA